MKYPIARLICLSAAVALFGAVLPAGLTADDEPIRIGYSFNEGTNAGSGATDYYGVLDGAWSGTWQGSAFFGPGFSGEEGDYSFTSDPSGNRVRVEANDVLGDEWGSFTVEVHFTIGAPTDHFHRLVDMEPFDRILQKNTINRLRTSIGGTIQTDTLEEDRWYHAAAVYDVEAGIGSLYLDGELVGSGDIIDWETPDPIHIGASSTGGSRWNGYIDNFRLTNAALEPEDFLLEGFGTDFTEPPPAPDPIPGVRVFWSELDRGEIRTGTLDGESATTVISGLERPIGIAIDKELGHIYWAEDAADGQGRIGRATMEGTDLTTVVGGLNNPQMVALDSGAGHVYWTEHFPAQNGGIKRADLDGGNLVVIDQFNQRYTPLALDLENGHIYFGDPENGILQRIGLDGENYVEIAEDASAEWGLNAVALGPGGDKLYFPDVDAVQRSDLDGSNIERLVEGMDLPLGIAFSADGEWMVWAERNGDLPGRLHAARPDGSDHGIFYSNLDSPFGVAVIAEDVPETSFAQWQADHFTPEELEDESIGGPEAAPAGDGIPNLLKYALGLGNPKAPARHLLPQPDVVVGELQLTFPRALSAEDVELFAEFSEDLQTWESGEDVVEIVGTVEDGDIEWVTVRVIAPVADLDRAFLRLQSLLEP